MSRIGHTRNAHLHTMLKTELWAVIDVPTQVQELTIAIHDVKFSCDYRCLPQDTAGLTRVMLLLCSLTRLRELGNASGTQVRGFLAA